MEGKSVQDMLKCAKDKSFSILDCIDDKLEEKVKFQRALTNLQQVSDVLKNPHFQRFEEDQLAKIRRICEKWGRDWPKDFPYLNLTPKGHVLSFVLPKILDEHKTFHKFYAMEELGESIHAALNDIERKIWFVNILYIEEKSTLFFLRCIKNPADQLWKFVERYELHNHLDLSIVTPLKRNIRRPGK